MPDERKKKWSEMKVKSQHIKGNKKKSKQKIKTKIRKKDL